MNKILKDALINFLLFPLAIYSFLTWQFYDAYKNEATDFHYSVHHKTTLITSLLISICSVFLYYCIVRQLYAKKKIVAAIFVFIAFYTAIAFLDTTLTLAVQPDEFNSTNYWDGFEYGILRTLVYIFIATIYSLIRTNIYLSKTKRELENENLQSSLQLLKGQLDPHFLFNSLNTIYATAQMEHADKTAESIEELSHLFRYSLKEANEEKVSVEKELKFIEKYLHLQQIRLPQNDNINVNIKIHWDRKPALISPMLLIPFIENAFKYGISYQHRSTIDIDLTIVNKKLSLNIVNSIHKADNETNSIGISNAAKRLELQYPDNFSLKHYSEHNHYHVYLTINL